MGEFQRDEVLYFMLKKGGRVRNHELVTHFKNFLDHPNNKAKNRVLFKDYVNELATVRVDGGEKVLVLKKKYRPTSESFGSSASVSSTSISSLSTSSSQNSLYKSAASSAGGSDTDAIPTRYPIDGAPRGSSLAPETTPTAQPESPRAKSEPPQVVDSPDGVGMSKVLSDEQMDVVMRHTDRLPQYVPDSPSASGSNVSLVSNTSTTSSTSGMATDEDANASIISVKDKITKLNKIATETSISRQIHGDGGKSGQKKKYTNGGEEDDLSHSSGVSYVQLEPEQREWMVTCSGTDYHDMNRLLSKNPGLARLKDLTNGYTALHWAAKSGKAEVIKLIANKPGVNVDQRSHGGYTPLHLAAIHGHEHIIELLVQTFKADANLRDYSGRKAKQYLKNSASSKAQQLLMSRRLGPDQVRAKVGPDDSFIRSASMRMSSRAKAMSSLMQSTSAVARQPLLRSSWGGSYEDVTEDRGDGMRKTSAHTPPGSGTPSPLQARRKHSYRDVNLMPPPSNSVLGRKPRYHLDRSRSSSRESLSSSRSSLKNDENQNNMLRSESDPSLIEGTMV